MPQKNTGLGRGLGALFGQEAVREAETGSLRLRLSEIEPRSDQPRRVFDDGALEELAESIRQHGVLQPIAVRRLPTGYYQIIAGERRWRAARMAGLEHVPASVFDADDRKAVEMALIENLQREDLNPVEEAEGFRMLIEDYGLTQEDAATRVGRSRPAVANSLRLLTLSDKIKGRLESGDLTAGHARLLLQLGGDAERERAAARVVDGRLSVRQTEELVKKMENSEDMPPAAAEREPNYVAGHEQRLSELFGRKARIVAGARRGRVELEFYSPEDLEQLMGQLIGRGASD
ncbi:MAG: ParB/RepB/Spo0J family partition protein [Oscillospiraceae bacterium]|nr:ParB/RepB/Spo0J family partition protein [Oscillospiraceae bacterium]